MEEKIKKTERLLSRFYMVFWALPILVVAAGEFNWLPTGDYAGNFMTNYCLEFAGILLAATLVPVSLNLFHWTLLKKIDKLPFDRALLLYGRMSIIRLSLLAIITIFNLISYYLVMSTTCMLCACIGLVASFFCIPSDRRLREELQITTDKK